MQERLGMWITAKRGPHISKLEKDIENLKNSNISKAYLINYDDIKPYEYNSNDTLITNTLESKSVYTDLGKKYKNSRPRNYDIVISQRSSYTTPHFVYFGNNNLADDYIYDNSVIFVRSISDKINMKYVFYLMSTNKIRNKINISTQNQNPKHIKCATIEDIIIDLPSLDEQDKIVKELEKNYRKLENMII